MWRYRNYRMYRWSEKQAISELILQKAIQQTFFVIKCKRWCKQALGIMNLDFGAVYRNGNIQNKRNCMIGIRPLEYFQQKVATSVLRSNSTVSYFHKTFTQRNHKNIFVSFLFVQNIFNNHSSREDSGRRAVCNLSQPGTNTFKLFDMLNDGTVSCGYILMSNLKQIIICTKAVGAHL